MANIILVTHQKGGVGKTTIVFNLAANLHETQKVGIVDMDAQGSITALGALCEVPVHSSAELDEVLKMDYDWIFIDTPPYLSTDMSELCKLADIIVVPTKAGILDLLAIKSTLDIIKKAKCEDKALIVFNMIKPNTSLTGTIKTQIEEFNVPVAETQISDLVSFSRSVVTKGVEEHEKAQSQIDSLTQELIHILIK